MPRRGLAAHPDRLRLPGAVPLPSSPGRRPARSGIRPAKRVVIWAGDSYALGLTDTNYLLDKYLLQLESSIG
jgi:hypothetical protein